MGLLTRRGRILLLAKSWIILRQGSYLKMLELHQWIIMTVLSDSTLSISLLTTQMREKSYSLSLQVRWSQTQLLIGLNVRQKRMESWEPTQPTPTKELLGTIMKIGWVSFSTFWNHILEKEKSGLNARSLVSLTVMVARRVRTFFETICINSWSKNRLSLRTPKKRLGEVLKQRRGSISKQRKRSQIGQAHVLSCFWSLARHVTVWM